MLEILCDFITIESHLLIFPQIVKYMISLFAIAIFLTLRY